MGMSDHVNEAIQAHDSVYDFVCRDSNNTAAIMVLAMAIEELGNLGIGLMEIAAELNNLSQTLYDINEKNRNSKKGG